MDKTAINAESYYAIQFSNGKFLHDCPSGNLSYSELNEAKRFLTQEGAVKATAKLEDTSDELSLPKEFNVVKVVSEVIRV